MGDGSVTKVAAREFASQRIRVTAIARGSQVLSFR